VFHFTGNFQLPEGEQPAQPKRSFAKIQGLHVLVVDDNATNRRILEQMLLGWNMKPTVVASGEAALAALRLAIEERRPFQLVITDHNMPGMDGFTLSERIVQQQADLGDPAIIMLTSSQLMGDTQRSRTVGIASFMTKPVNQSDLYNSILKSLGVSPTEGIRKRDKLATTQDFATLVAAMPPTKILLAEDNPINQTLALTILEGWGHTIVLAQDGVEAVEAFEREPFDIVLMDMQMPRKDGFEATASIRDLEKKSGTHIPIIALTAHALKGDRERCLEGGMDGYVSKPLQEEALYAEIVRLVPTPTVLAATATAAEPAPSAPAPAPVFKPREPRVPEVPEVLPAPAHDGAPPPFAPKPVVDTPAPFAPRAASVPPTPFAPKPAAGDTPAPLAPRAPFPARPVGAPFAPKAGDSGEVPAPFWKQPGGAPVVAPVAPVATASAAPADIAEVLDMAVLQSRLGNKKALLRKISAQFLDLYGQQLADIGTAVQAGDMDNLYKAAHKFKGSLGNFAAGPAVQAALALEQIGKHGPRDEARPAYEKLEVEVRRLAPVIESFAKDES
jgi:CheY-like chemotaxis protein